MLYTGESCRRTTPGAPDLQTKHPSTPIVQIGSMPHFEVTPTRSSETATHALESMGGLLENPLDDPGIVVTETKVMIQGGEAMSLA